MTQLNYNNNNQPEKDKSNHHPTNLTMINNKIQKKIHSHQIHIKYLILHKIKKIQIKSTRKINVLMKINQNKNKYKKNIKILN
jgi:hypothetical protein